VEKYRQRRNAKRNDRCRGMQDMLWRLDMKFEGRPHSGIDDTRNIAKCALKLIHDGVKFEMIHIQEIREYRGKDKNRGSYN